jgi:hypothetical protein
MSLCVMRQQRHGRKVNYSADIVRPQQPKLDHLHFCLLSIIRRGILALALKRGRQDVPLHVSDVTKNQRA